MQDNILAKYLFFCLYFTTMLKWILHQAGLVTVWQLCLPAGVWICEDRSSLCQNTQWNTGPCWRWCCGDHRQGPLPPDCLLDPAWHSALGPRWSHREPCLTGDHWETDNLSWVLVTVSSVTCSHRLTWVLHGRSSGSDPCLRICGTAAWPKGWTAPSALTEARRLPFLSPAPPSAVLWSSTLQTAHCHGYRHTRRPVATLANTPARLPPSDCSPRKQLYTTKIDCTV